MPAACGHCGLPVPRRPVRGRVDGEDFAFCCVGCLIALQVTRARGESGAASAILARLGLAIFFAMNVMMLSAPAYVPRIYGGGAEAVDGPLFVGLRVMAAVMSLPVLLLLGGPVAASA